MITEAVVTDAFAAIVSSPPGFRQFSWPRDDWMVVPKHGSGETPWFVPLECWGTAG